MDGALDSRILSSPTRICTSPSIVVTGGTGAQDIIEEGKYMFQKAVYSMFQDPHHQPQDKKWCWLRSYLQPHPATTIRLASQELTGSAWPKLKHRSTRLSCSPAFRSYKSVLYSGSFRIMQVRYPPSNPEKTTFLIRNQKQHIFTQFHTHP